MQRVLPLLLLLSLACKGGASGELDGALPDGALDGGVDDPRLLGPQSLAAGGASTCALIEDGAVKCWGAGGAQLGYGDARLRGCLAEEMGDQLPQVDLGDSAPVIALSAGFEHVCALLEGGEVKCWGGNLHGELGIGDTQTRGDQPDELGSALPVVDLGPGRSAVAISAGFYHTCALLDDDSVKCWGDNRDGQLGLGDTDARGDEPGEMGDALPAVDLGTNREARAIAAGDRHTCALLDDQTIRCWGYNGQGQLGIGDPNNRGDQVDELGDFLPAVSLGDGARAIGIAAGSLHSCALLESNQIKCWGENAHGQLGIGDTERRGDGPNEMGEQLPAIELGAGLVPARIAADDRVSCAFMTNGAVKCWGYNGFGQLGLGDTNSRGDGPNEMGEALAELRFGVERSPVAIVAGEEHLCARTEDGAIFCVGDDGLCQLGVGGFGNGSGYAPESSGHAVASVYLGGRPLPHTALFVPSRETHQVLVYDMDGHFDRVFATIRNPTGLALANNGDVYVSGRDSVKRYTLAGEYVAEIVTPSPVHQLAAAPDSQIYGTMFQLDSVDFFISTNNLYGGAFIAAGSGGLDEPTGLVFDFAGTLYVASRAVSRIFLYDASATTFINTGDRIGAPGMNGLHGLTLGPDGDVYAAFASSGASGTGFIIRFARDGSLVSTLMETQRAVSDGMSVVFDDDGDFLISVQVGDAVERYDSAGTYLGDAVSPNLAGLNYPGQLLIITQPD